MAHKRAVDADFSQLKTPAYVIDLGVLTNNLRLLGSVQVQAGCKVLMALKGFAFWRAAPLVREFLSGVAASSVHEARLGREEFQREVHTYCPAYSPQSFPEIVRYSDHIVFNSLGQYRRLLPELGSLDPKGTKRLGLRVNPEHSEVAVPLYDPCAEGSRLGVTASQLGSQKLDGLSGLHFHTLCQMTEAALERTLRVVERRFPRLLARASWVNFGGGHHITRSDYNVDRLVNLIGDFKQQHHVEVYLEPGEANALNAGVLVTSVLDIIENDVRIAMLDTSAAAHMPDVLEMPYRPEVLGGFPSGHRPHTYRLGGLTCLAGDVIGDYSFERPLEVGDKIVFLDMAHYTMVKNTTFNGVGLPDIVSYDPESDRLQVVRRFGYDDYKNRLA